MVIAFNIINKTKGLLFDSEMAFFSVAFFVSLDALLNDLIGFVHITPAFDIHFLLLKILVNLEEMLDLLDKVTVHI